MVEPAGAVAGGAREVDNAVEHEEEKEGGGRRGVRGDEFEPGEGEESGRGGPQTEVYGEGAACGRVSAECPADDEVERTQGVEESPDGTEEERGGDQPDPEEHIDTARGRVVLRPVRAEEEVEQDEQGGGQAEDARDHAGGAGVGETLEGDRDRPARPVPAESGGGPEQAEGEKRDEEGGERTGERVEGGQRQIVLGADAVSEDVHRTTSWVSSSADSWVSTSNSPVRSAVRVRVVVRPARRRASLS